MDAREHIERVCAPANARWDRAWARCVASTRLANEKTHLAHEHAEAAVKKINIARQLIDYTLLQPTVPYEIVADIEKVPV